jgi:hypothetical protein
MSPENLIGQLQEYSGDDIINFLNSMYEDENIELKSDFKNPIAVSKGQLLADWLDIEGLSDSAELWRKFLNYHSRNMVSYKRGSRDEGFRAVSHILEKEENLREKMLGGGKEGSI